MPGERRAVGVNARRQRVSEQCSFSKRLTLPSGCVQRALTRSNALTLSLERRVHGGPGRRRTT